MNLLIPLRFKKSCKYYNTGLVMFGLSFNIKDSVLLPIVMKMNLKGAKVKYYFHSKLWFCLVYYAL